MREKRIKLCSIENLSYSLVITLELLMICLAYFACVVNIMQMFTFMVKRRITEGLGDLGGLGNDLLILMFDFKHCAYIEHSY